MLSKQPYVISDVGRASGMRVIQKTKRSEIVGKRRSEVRSIAAKEAQRVLNKNIELKYFAIVDNTYGSISYNGTDFVQSMSSVPQGDTDSTRDGDRIKLKEIRFRVGIKTGSTTPTFLRVICFQWKPNTTPVYANILLDQHNTSAASLSDFTHDTRQMYHILSDDLVQVDTVAHPATCVERSIKSGFEPYIQYQAGSSSNATNMIYVMAVSDVNSNGPLVILFGKLLYYDA
jgi:hypothetical protein